MKAPLSRLCLRRACCFFSGIVLLHATVCLAGDNPDQKGTHNQPVIPKTVTESLEKDLGDFFEEDPAKVSLETESEDLDDFFSDDQTALEPDEIPDSQAGNDESHYFLKGSVALKTGYRFNHDPPLPGATDQRGLSDVKGEIDLEFGARVSDAWTFVVSGSAAYNLAYELNNRSTYTDPFLDENEKEIELEKLFIRGRLSTALDIKIGRQIVVWGKSDNIRVTDVLNPLDIREPGMTDIEDLRLPVFMTRLDYYVSNWSLSGFLIHEHRSNKIPVFGSSYFYLPSSLPVEIEPSNSLENTEMAVSLSGIFPGFDVSFYLARIYDDMAYLTAENQRLHEKVSMAGVALNKASGNFLVKAETALFNGIRLSAFQQKGLMVENDHEYSRVDVLAGIEYTGFANTVLSLEAADRWLTDYDENAQKSNHQEHTVQYALRTTKTFLNEVMELMCLASLYGKTADDGGFIRAQASWDMTDDLRLTLGTVMYSSGSHVMLKRIGENDLVFSSIRYSF